MKSFLAADICFLKTIPALLGMLIIVTAPSFAQEEDKEGCKDHTMFPRMPNFYIYTCQELDDYDVRTEKGAWTQVRGKVHRVLYEIKSDAKRPSAQQIVRNYQNDVKKIGGNVLYEDQYYTSLKMTQASKTYLVIVSSQNTGESYELTVVEEVGKVQDVSAKELSYATITNKKYGFTIKYPSAWGAQSTYISPPPDIEDFKSGKAELRGTLSTSYKSSENDNAVKFNAVVYSDDPTPPPSIDVYAHSTKPKTFDEYTKELKEWQAMFGQKMVSSKKITTATGLEGYDYVYATQIGNREVLTRLTVFFKNGKRFGLTYFDQDKDNFMANEKIFDELLNSFVVN